MQFSGANSSRIHADKQGKHIVGHRNFKVGKSILTHSDPEKLLKEFAGTGSPIGIETSGRPGFKEIVDFGELVGEFYDLETKLFSPTTRGAIHYDKNGFAHIVPIRQKIK